MLIDCILVIVGIIAFLIPAILQKERRSQLKTDFLGQLPRLVVLSGLFVSVVKILILISDMENLLGTNENGIFSISSTAFFYNDFCQIPSSPYGDSNQTDFAAIFKKEE